MADYASKEPITKKTAFLENKITISGKVTAPQVAVLQLQMQIPNGTRMQGFPLFLEAGNIVVTVDDHSFSVGGTPQNDALFNAIPYIILFAPDGTIVASGLRGENLEKKLTEIFE